MKGQFLKVIKMTRYTTVYYQIHWEVTEMTDKICESGPGNWMTL